MKMKMNFKYAALACAALMAGFTSCSNDEVVDGGGDEVAGKSTIAKITLVQTAASSSRAAQIFSEPTPAEKTINTAALYIFSKTKRFVKKVDFVASQGTVVTELTTGPHYFYALVNNPDAYPDYTAGTTMDAVLADVNNQLDLTSISLITDSTATGKGFMMSSLGDAVYADLVEATQAEAEATTGAKNQIALKVGRTMAKLNTSFEVEATNQPQTGVLSDVDYQAVNNPKKMYRLPLYNLGGQLLTPYYSVATADTSNYFPNLPATFDMGGWITAMDNKDKQTHVTYFVENSNEKPQEGNSSMVLLRGVFTPEAALIYDGSNTPNATANVDGTFYCLAVETAGEITHVNKQRFYTTDALNLAAINTAIADGNTYNTVIKYDKGHAYYPFWLENTASERIAKYTAARNSYYGVTITSVSDLGANTPAAVIPDPTKPLGAEAWIKGTIEVLDWTLVTQTGGI